MPFSAVQGTQQAPEGETAFVSKTHFDTFLKHLSESHLCFSFLFHHKGTQEMHKIPIHIYFKTIYAN